jgi:hypothetical protein
LICFSRPIADMTSFVASKYTSFDVLYFPANPSPVPSRCSATLRSRSLVTPVQRPSVAGHDVDVVLFQSTRLPEETGPHPRFFVAGLLRMTLWSEACDPYDFRRSIFGSYRGSAVTVTGRRSPK